MSVEWNSGFLVIIVCQQLNWQFPVLIIGIGWNRALCATPLLAYCTNTGRLMNEYVAVVGWLRGANVMITGDSHIPDEERMLLAYCIIRERENERESHRAYLTLLNAWIQKRHTYTLGVIYHVCFYCQIYHSECLHSDRLLCENYYHTRQTFL
jgi:hypothetical protein